MPPILETVPNPIASSMSLRDYFAAMAMQAYLQQDKPVPFLQITEYAYKAADAMLIQRTK